MTFTMERVVMSLSNELYHQVEPSGIRMSEVYGTLCLHLVASRLISFEFDAMLDSSSW